MRYEFQAFALPPERAIDDMFPNRADEQRALVRRLLVEGLGALHRSVGADPEAEAEVNQVHLGLHVAEYGPAENAHNIRRAVFNSRNEDFKTC